MLLSYLVYQQNFTTSVSKLDIDDGSRNRGEQEHVGKDEHNIVDIIWHVILNS